MRTFLLTLILAMVGSAQNLNLVWEGSSSTACYGVSGPQCFSSTLVAAAITGITVHNSNISDIGTTVGDYATCPSSIKMVCKYTSNAAPHLNEYVGKNTLWLQNATNDLCYGGGVDGAGGYARVLDYLARANPAWKFVTMTQTPRNAVSGVDVATCEAYRMAYNSLALAGCGAGKVRIYYDATNHGAAYRCQAGAPFQYLVDVAADTRIGCDGCQSNTTYYQSDGTHGNATWHGIVAGMVVPAVQDSITPHGLFPLPTPFTRQ